MSMTIKRKSSDPIKTLPSGYDGLLVKKSKSSEVLKFSMENKSVKKRVLHIVKLLSCHIFATPFLKSEKDEVTGEYQQSFEDVLEKVETNTYENSQQVFADLTDILEETIITKKKVKKVIVKSNQFKILNYSQEDVEVMATQIERKIYEMQESLFSDVMQNAENVHNTDIIQQKEDADKIHETLQSKHSLVPSKALTISISKSLDIEAIKQELEEASKKCPPTFQCYKFFPSRNHEFSMDKAVHSYIAGYQFHKMITKASAAPVPMRTVLNMSDSIESIIYIENKESSAAYEEQKESFKQNGTVGKNGKVEEMLLFHGTAVSSLESIIATNFIVDALPQQKNTQNEPRKKTMMFGRGVYFSELPAISLMYGNGLLLCKVLPGNCEIFKPQGVTPPEISDQFDSREVLSNSSEGVIHVVKRPSQILPYCVIQLKKQSLSSQYIKPAQCVQPNTQTQCVKLNSSPQLPAHSKPNQTAEQEGWSVVKADQPKAYNKMKMIEKTIQNCTTLTTSCLDQELCSICCNPLGSGQVLSLSKCGHKFHSLCIQDMILKQAGQQHIQCPNCQTIHGIKTGNQPMGGEMSFKRTTVKVPGHPDCGMIVIKYTMVDGIQTECHPRPGKQFSAKGFPRVAILPDNEKGNIVLGLLVKAFRQRIVFTVGPSLSRGEEGCVTWNGIHHKTQLHDNGNGHGYPDIGYLDRVREELKQNGVE